MTPPTSAVGTVPVVPIPPGIRVACTCAPAIGLFVALFTTAPSIEPLPDCKRKNRKAVDAIILYLVTCNSPRSLWNRELESFQVCTVQYMVGSGNLESCRILGG